MGADGNSRYGDHAIRTTRPVSRARHDLRVLILALLGGLPGVALGLVLLWRLPWEPVARWTLALAVLLAWLGCALALRALVVHPLHTLANLLAALREGDFSIRARVPHPGEALGLVFHEVNTLSHTLREQRIGALEATALLRTVMEEIELAVFAFDGEGRLRLVNRAGERLLGRPAPRLMGLRAAELGLGGCLDGPAPRVIDAAFPGAMGRWELRRGRFRQGGESHDLLVLADLSRALREEERAAWQRLIRVLSHEVNNSLAPIQSIATTLQSLLQREPRPADADEDLEGGLAVIAGRSAALARFMAAYAHLARLPPPSPAPVQVSAWVRHAAGLERRVSVRLREGPPLTIRADADQLEQLLINLVRNAADAALETGGGVEVGWETQGPRLLVCVRDEGRGLPESANLFVPFFTTKPDGSGIGLALSRQIAEAHGGVLTLANRDDRQGAEARLMLPLE